MIRRFRPRVFLDSVSPHTTPHDLRLIGVRPVNPTLTFPSQADRKRRSGDLYVSPDSFHVVLNPLKFQTAPSGSP